MSTASDDVNRLLDVLVQLSMDFLVKRDAFVPHAAALHADGSLKFSMADVGDEATEEERLELLRAELREKAAAGDITACGIAVDVTYQEDDGTEGEAVRVELDHEDDDEDAVMVIVPYVKGDDGYEIGELSAFLSDAPIFGDDPEA